MLTQNDLNKIGDLIETKLETKLDSKFEEKLKPIKSSLRKISSKMNFFVKVLDKNHIELHKRFDDHLESLHLVSAKTI